MFFEYTDFSKFLTGQWERAIQIVFLSLFIFLSVLLNPTGTQADQSGWLLSHVEGPARPVPVSPV
jgi:hypothetical protein